MRKYLFPSIMLMLLSSMLLGYWSSQSETAGPDNRAFIKETGPTLKKFVEPIGQEVNVPQELEQLVNHFRDAGFKIGNYSEKRYDLIGASAGFGLEVGGQEIELYYFDPAKTDQDVLDDLKDLHKPEAPMAVVINGYYQMMVAFHPEQEKIIESFMSFEPTD